MDPKVFTQMQIDVGVLKESVKNQEKNVSDIKDFVKDISEKIEKNQRKNDEQFLLLMNRNSQENIDTYRKLRDEMDSKADKSELTSKASKRVETILWGAGAIIGSALLVKLLSLIIPSIPKL